MATFTSNNYVVPTGCVLVVRRVDAWIEEEIPTNSYTVSMARGEGVFKLYIDGVAVPYNSVRMGANMPYPMKTFFLVDEGQSLSSTLVTASDPGVQGTYTFYTQVYGQLLAKTGRALPFEIANFGSGVSTEGKRA